MEEKRFDSMDMQVFDAYGFLKLREERIICVNGPITDKLSMLFNIAVLEMEQDDPDADITIHINSPGGSVSAGLAMIDTMNVASCDVATVCVGMAASMGAMLLMAGTKGKRRILPHSYVLIHQPLGGTQGQARDIEIYAEEIKRQKEVLYSMISEATGQDVSKVAADCDRDYTMSAQEALDYGIVDRILTKHTKD